MRRVSDSVVKPYSFSGMQKIVHTMRDKLGLPSTFTLDACRHGGMTELEEAELTDGQGRALSATRKRHAHKLANAKRTLIQNEPSAVIQNGEAASGKLSAK